MLINIYVQNILISLCLSLKLRILQKSHCVQNITYYIICISSFFSSRMFLLACALRLVVLRLIWFSYFSSSSFRFFHLYIHVLTSSDFSLLYSFFMVVIHIIFIKTDFSVSILTTSFFLYFIYFI